MLQLLYVVLGLQAMWPAIQLATWPAIWPAAGEMAGEMAGQAIWPAGPAASAWPGRWPAFLRVGVMFFSYQRCGWLAL